MAKLSDAEVSQRLSSLAQWETDGPAIVREWKLADFDAALAFLNAVGELAQAANHHPDMLLHGWNKVRLTLSTHSEGGLTDADFRLASQIDRLA